MLPGVVRHTFIIFGLFTTPNLCPLTQNPGDDTAGKIGGGDDLGVSDKIVPAYSKDHTLATHMEGLESP